jgi:hypothetical protein
LPPRRPRTRSRPSGIRRSDSCASCIDSTSGDRRRGPRRRAGGAVMAKQWIPTFAQSGPSPAHQQPRGARRSTSFSCRAVIGGRTTLRRKHKRPRASKARTVRLSPRHVAGPCGSDRFGRFARFFVTYHFPARRPPTVLRPLAKSMKLPGSGTDTGAGAPGPAFGPTEYPELSPPPCLLW